METNFIFNSKAYNLKRYPKTEDKNLRAWSNAEVLALDFIKDKKVHKVHLFNDRFGVWNCSLHDKNCTTIWTYASQKKAIQQNLKLNNLTTEVDYKAPLDQLKEIELALLKIPKSLDLFELFLAQIHKASSEKTEVVCSFMTKYFSASYLKIASKYFEEVEQTKAWKKARLLVLKHPKKSILAKKYINTIQWNDEVLQQYYGVFSSDKIDVGTQFLLQNLSIKQNEENILDVASGNGIIALEASKQNPNALVTLVDDFNLAVASSQLNLKGRKASFVCNNSLESLSENHFDLVLSNPPFHFEHENNIDVSLTLFKEVFKVLHSRGRFLLVANKHLNYKTHLEKIFKDVFLLEENKKFVIYQCKKH